MIELPNEIECKNWTYLCVFDSEIDLAPLAQPDLPESMRSQLSRTEVGITVSTVNSEFGRYDREKFTELLIKVPAHIGGTAYTFPVRTYVDSELSLIRGFLLGFYKKFAPRLHSEPAPYHVEVDELNFHLHEVTPVAATGLDQFIPYDRQIITYANYSAGVSEDRGGLRVLDCRDRVETCRPVQYRTSGGGDLLGQKFEITSMWTTASQFLISGSTLVADDRGRTDDDVLA